MFFIPPVGYLLLSGKITPEPPLLQAACSQLSQPLSMCQILQSLLRSSALLCTHSSICICFTGSGSQTEPRAPDMTLQGRIEKNYLP